MSGTRSGIRRPHYGKGSQFVLEQAADHYRQDLTTGKDLNLAQPYILDGGVIESAMTRKSSGYEHRNSMHRDHGQRRVDRETGKKY